MAMILPRLNDIWAPLTAPVAEQIIAMLRDPAGQARVKPENLVTTLFQGFNGLPQLAEVVEICIAQDIESVSRNLDAINDSFHALPAPLRLELIQLRLRYKLFISHTMLLTQLEDPLFLQWLSETPFAPQDALLLLASLPEPTEISPAARATVTDVLCRHAHAFYADLNDRDRKVRLAKRLLAHVPLSSLTEDNADLDGLRLLLTSVEDRGHLLANWAENPEQLLRRMRLSKSANDTETIAAITESFPLIAQTIRKTPQLSFPAKMYPEIAYLFEIGLNCGAVQLGDLQHWIPPRQMSEFMQWAGGVRINISGGRLFQALLANCPDELKSDFEQALIDRLRNNKWGDAITLDLVSSFPRVAAEFVTIHGRDPNVIKDLLLIACSETPARAQAADCFFALVHARGMPDNAALLHDTLRHNDSAPDQLTQLNRRMPGKLDDIAIHALLNDESSPTEAPYLFGDTANLWVTLCGLDRDCYAGHRNRGKSPVESFLATRYPELDAVTTRNVLIGLGAREAPLETASPMIQSVLPESAAPGESPLVASHG